MINKIAWEINELLAGRCFFFIRSSVWGLTYSYTSCKLHSSTDCRRSHTYCLGFLGSFWWGGTLKHQPSSPGSCVPWPLGGTTGKQMTTICCARAGFHLPACGPSAGTLQSLGLTQTTPRHGCLSHWLRFLLPINHHDNSSKTAVTAALRWMYWEQSLRLHHGLLKMPSGYLKGRTMKTLRMNLTLQDLTQWHNFPRSLDLQIQRGKVSFQAPGACHCPRGGISQVPMLETAQTITLETNRCKACCQVWKPAQTLPPEAV